MSDPSGRPTILSVGSSVGPLARVIASKLGHFLRDTGGSVRALRKAPSSALPSGLAFLSQDQLLRWLEGVTSSTATVYDKALDANYLATHIGGGKHRLFDGGHDLLGAWQRARDALPDDSFNQQVVGYVTALWKDISTPAGLPITTVSKEGYDAWADKITSAVPGVDRNWFSDLLSVDALEVVGTSLSVASALYFLKKDDTEKLSEILGAMGMIGIATANPLLGIAAVLLTAHAYAVRKQKLEGKSVAVGSGLALVSVGLFTILGMAVLVEFGIALVVTALIRKQVFGRDNFLRYLRGKIGALPGRFSTVTAIRIPKFRNT